MFSEGGPSGDWLSLERRRERRGAACESDGSSGFVASFSVHGPATGETVSRCVGLTLELHAFVSVLIRLQLSLVHCSRSVLLPLDPPPLSWSLGGISVTLNRSWQLIFSTNWQSYGLIDSFVERHLTPDIHSAHIGGKVLAPGLNRSFLRPAGGLCRVLVRPLYWSILLIVRYTLRPFLWVVNTRAASRVGVAWL
ncbi:hypothetical protein EYF80_013704 [Liparis tanakae]|uniref:Uncharacterized protein n=1 Tax=Liparis tanakae TaxID=230148 RepID=A0A4Z2IGB1_9TELE|nr:hypothetical protein EYF80_013704 [Liparis tanakae]